MHEDRTSIVDADFPMPRRHRDWPIGQQAQDSRNGHAGKFRPKPLIRLLTHATHAAQGEDGRAVDRSASGGALSLPSERERLQAMDRHLRWMGERTAGKHAGGTNIIPFSVHRIDELLADMTLSVGGMQRFIEWQVPVKPGKHAPVARELHARLQ